MFSRINFAVWVSLLAAAAASAGEPDTGPKPYPLPTAADHARAGNPTCVSRLAHPDRNHHYLGGWIGGGCLCRGGGRSAQYDGTFGYDYVAFGHFPGRLFLGWCHGRRHQPSAGSYEPTGPEVVDIFAAKPVQHAVHENREAHPRRHHGHQESNGHNGGGH